MEHYKDEKQFEKGGETIFAGRFDFVWKTRVSEGFEGRGFGICSKGGGEGAWEITIGIFTK